jgi:hypothetical protein
MGEGFKDRIFFVMDAKTIKPGTYELNDPGQRYIFVEHHSQQCTFQTDNYYSGMLMITAYEPTKNIIAGSFEFLGYSEACQQVLNVSKGSFDVQYKGY